MAVGTVNSAEILEEDLPRSKLIYPEQFKNKLKYFFWRLYTPFHPYVRDTLLALKIMWHEGRQDYLLGKVAPGQTLEGIVSYLVKRGYGNHFIAWKDDGEVIGLRYMREFSRQYHIRIFEDGEIRAHYEYSPECYPILHMKAVDMEQRREEFLNLLGDRIVVSK